MKTFCCVVVAAHLLTFVLQWFHWPLSNYTMFSYSYDVANSGTLVYRLRSSDGKTRQLPVNNTPIGLLTYQDDVTPELWARLKKFFLERQETLTLKEKIFHIRGLDLNCTLKALGVDRKGQSVIVEYKIFVRNKDAFQTQESICLDAETLEKCRD